MKKLFSHNDFLKAMAPEGYRTIMAVAEELSNDTVQFYDRRRKRMGLGSAIVEPGEALRDWMNVDPLGLLSDLEEGHFNTKDRFWVMDCGCFISTNKPADFVRELIDALYDQYEIGNIDDADIVTTFEKYKLEV